MTADIRRLLSAIAPEGVCVGVSPIGERQIGLYAEESEAVARAVSSRRREFAAGRRAARRALSAMGERKSALPSGPDRVPLWPSGVVGSISHTEALATAVVAPARLFAALGLDIETISRVTLDLERIIVNEAEKPRLAALALPEVGLALAFSAKEAWYKCQYPATRTYFGFHDVEAHFDESAGSFEVRPVSAEARAVAPVLKGAFVFGDDIVACLATSPLA